MYHPFRLTYIDYWQLLLVDHESKSSTDILASLGGLGWIDVVPAIVK